MTEYQGIWAVPLKHIQDFFEKEQIPFDGTDYVYGKCTITLLVLEPKGILRIPQIKVIMKGEEKDTEEIHQKFFFNFLSAGG